jgi:hypothetical protein
LDHAVKTVTISSQSERRERDLQELFRRAKKPVALFRRRCPGSAFKNACRVETAHRSRCRGRAVQRAIGSVTTSNGCSSTVSNTVFTPRTSLPMWRRVRAFEAVLSLEDD